MSIEGKFAILPRNFQIFFYKQFLQVQSPPVIYYQSFNVVEDFLVFIVPGRLLQGVLSLKLNEIVRALQFEIW